MSACLALEAPQRVAVLGPQGTFCEQAAVEFFGSAANLIYCNNFDEVFHATAAGTAQFGVVGMENSTEGVVARSLDLFLRSPVHVVGEVSLLIRHNLMRKEPSMHGIEAVLAHPQALAQCERYLRGLGVQVEAVYDTAGGAKLVSEQKLVGAAALASRRAATVFGLEVLQEAVQDYEFNITRFAIIGGAQAEDANKTTIVFALPSTHGALFKALSVFALRDINLSKLESRPFRGRPWEYLFYVEVDARRDDLACTRALTHLGEFATFMRVLGTYKGWVRAAAPTARG